MKSLYAADIRENQPIDDLFLVAQKNHGVTKGGSGYGTAPMIWDGDLSAMTLSGCAARRRCIKEKCKSGCRT